MRARDVATKIEAVASKAWEDSQIMPTDDALVYVQDALDVCRQLALKLVRAYERSDETRAEQNERHRTDL